MIKFSLCITSNAIKVTAEKKVTENKKRQLNVTSVTYIAFDISKESMPLAIFSADLKPD